jgi:hypothetical protein
MRMKISSTVEQNTFCKHGTKNINGNPSMEFNDTQYSAKPEDHPSLFYKTVMSHGVWEYVRVSFLRSTAVFGELQHSRVMPCLCSVVGELGGEKSGVTFNLV